MPDHRNRICSPGRGAGAWAYWCRSLHSITGLPIWLLAITGYDPGLVFTGTAAALVLAYVVRFFAIAQGTADAALGRVAPSLPMAARSLGRTAGGTLRAVHLPLVQCVNRVGVTVGLCRRGQGIACHLATAAFQL